ncbi:MAG: hypothetical protein E5X33_30315 [Mesorhizobium sp.]|uniref:hypothetical protein n=1 Tax=Mesorhizobium sp. TaxID=1871066 RepID=UPI0012031222|nr:hypothetical protein [Mesorhizobium sp.]TIR15946.1 MAG: hypothetical protein E5X33_30315 [Mesorhizobium sp.]
MKSVSDDLWSFIDVFTGLPARVDGFPLVVLDFQEPEQLSDLLNKHDVRKRNAQASFSIAYLSQVAAVRRRGCFAECGVRLSVLSFCRAGR